MKYQLIAAKLQQLKKIEENICYAQREGLNTSPLYKEHWEVSNEISRIS
jgi:hypothetical protein